MTEQIKPLSIFDKGPWVWKETGQHFTGEQLDAEAFAKYRLHVEQATAELRAEVESLRAVCGKALAYMESVGKMDMYPDEYQVVEELGAALKETK